MLAFADPHVESTEHEIVGNYIIHSPEKAAEMDKIIDGLIQNTNLMSFINRYICSMG